MSLPTALARLRQENALLHAENKRLRLIAAKLSHRRCWDCGHEDYYLLPVRPYCECAECGSADTRLVPFDRATESEKP